MHKIGSQSVFCLANCLTSALPPGPSEPPPIEASPLDLSLVPQLYHDLQEVFIKHKALWLPLHRPCDCAINLISRAQLPTSRLYSLSRPKMGAMKKYIRESLAAWKVVCCKERWYPNIRQVISGTSYPCLLCAAAHCGKPFIQDWKVWMLLFKFYVSCHFPQLHLFFWGGGGGRWRRPRLRSFHLNLWSWGHFHQAKTLFMSAPVLIYPDNNFCGM